MISISNADLERITKELDSKKNATARWVQHNPGPADMFKILAALKELRKHRDAQTPR